MLRVCSLCGKIMGVREYNDQAPDSSIRITHTICEACRDMIILSEGRRPSMIISFVRALKEWML